MRNAIALLLMWSFSIDNLAFGIPSEDLAGTITVTEMDIELVPGNRVTLVSLKPSKCRYYGETELSADESIYISINKRVCQDIVTDINVQTNSIKKRVNVGEKIFLPVDGLIHKVIEAANSDNVKASEFALDKNNDGNARLSSNIHIASPEYKSELNARLASSTIEKGIESVEVWVNESGGTNLTLFLPDGSAFKRIHSNKDFTSEMKPYNGYVRERISLLITAEPEDDQAILLKKIILSILEEKERV